MTRAYGTARMSIDEFMAAPLAAKWEVRRAKILQAMMTAANPTAKGIAEQLGISVPIVKAVMEQPRFQEHLQSILKGQLANMLPQCVSIIRGVLEDQEAPLAIKVNTAKWAIERYDYMSKQAAENRPAPIFGEAQMQEVLDRLKDRQKQRMLARAEEAEVVGVHDSVRPSVQEELGPDRSDGQESGLDPQRTSPPAREVDGPTGDGGGHRNGTADAALPGSGSEGHDHP